MYFSKLQNVFVKISKCICQNCYDVFVDLDVEGWVDGVYTRINGFTCCDSVDWCFSVHRPWPLVRPKAAKSITQIVNVLYRNLLHNQFRSCDPTKPHSQYGGFTLQTIFHFQDKTTKSQRYIRIHIELYWKVEYINWVGQWRCLLTNDLSQRRFHQLAHYFWSNLDATQKFPFWWLPIDM